MLQARPVVVDLFAGAGGFGLGFESAGFDVSLSVELDAWACDTLRVNHPQTINRNFGRKAPVSTTTRRCTIPKGLSNGSNTFGAESLVQMSPKNMGLGDVVETESFRARITTRITEDFILPGLPTP
jgi:site-specific DNA-cytosine methylase